MKIKYLYLRFTLTAGLCLANLASAQGISNLYVLGDSLSDQGNLYMASLADTGQGIPADDHYYMGRFADGENYAGILAHKLDLVLAPSYLGGNNYAYGGTRTDYNRVELDETKPPPVNLLGHGGIFPEDAHPWSLDGQRQAFAGRGVVDAQGLYIVFSGSNDMADLVTMLALSINNPAFNIDPASVIAKTVIGINDAIAAAVAAGAQDVIVPNVPNLGVVPSIARFGPNFSALATAVSVQYNQALGAMLAQWDGAVNIIPVDTFALLTDVVQNPAAYGFSNVSEPCYTGFVGPAGPNDTVCTDPDSYAFWDIEHPTTALHAVVADRILAVSTLDILDQLSEQLAASDIDPHLQASLARRLQGAIGRLSDDGWRNDGAARGKLRAFVHVLQVQSGTSIAADDAAYLVQRAQRVLSLLQAD